MILRVRCDYCGCGRMSCIDPQATKRTLALLIQVFQSAGNLINRRPQLFEQAKAGVREGHAARGPMQQACSEALLEMAHRMTESRCGHAKLRGRRAKAQVIGDDDKRIQVRKFATIHC